MSETTPGSAPLEKGARVQQYRIESLLWQDAFSYTYAATADNQRQVWLRELLPQEFVKREQGVVQPRDEADRSSIRWWLRRYQDQAAIVQRLQSPYLIKILHFFEANGTAYSVTEPVEGEPLSELLIREGVLSQSRLTQLLHPVLNGLSQLHRANVLHLNIHPDSLVVQPNGSVVLAHFSALSAPIRFKSTTLHVVGTAPYAAPDDLAINGRVGAWTDLYSVAAIAYRALSGQAPPSAPERVGGASLPSIAQTTRVQCTETLTSAIDQALRLAPEERPRSVATWQASLGLVEEILMNPTRSAAASPSPRQVPIDITQNGSKSQSKIWLAAIPFIALAGVAGYFVLGKTTPPANTQVIAPPPAKPVETAPAPAVTAAVTPAPPPVDTTTAPAAPNKSDSAFTEKLLQAQLEAAQASSQAAAKAKQAEANTPSPAAAAAAAAAAKEAQQATVRMQQLEAEVQRLRAEKAAAPAPTVQPPPQTLAQQASAKAAAAPKVPEPVRVEPVMDPKHSRPPDYPVSAREAREEGTVVLKIFVEIDGHISETQLLQSSGFPVLDNAALSDIKQRFRFFPGTTDGNPTSMWKTIKYTWKLN